MKNLYQVIKEGDLEEILHDHMYEITAVMFSSDKCITCMSILPNFIQIAQQFPNCFFVYVDINNFVHETNKYTQQIGRTPFFSYYYFNQQIGYVRGKNNCISVFSNTLNELIYKINEKKAKMNRVRYAPTTQT